MWTFDVDTIWIFVFYSNFSCASLRPEAASKEPKAFWPEWRERLLSPRFRDIFGELTASWK